MPTQSGPSHETRFRCPNSHLKRDLLTPLAHLTSQNCICSTRKEHSHFHPQSFPRRAACGSGNSVGRLARFRCRTLRNLTQFFRRNRCCLRFGNVRGGLPYLLDGRFASRCPCRAIFRSTHPGFSTGESAGKSAADQAHPVHRPQLPLRHRRR
jgi:hypothetical protein